MNKIRPNLCLYCGHFVELAHHPLDDSLVPKADDFTMCIRCGGLHCFNDDMTFRKAKPEELDRLDNEERELINEMLKQHAQLQQQRRTK